MLLSADDAGSSCRPRTCQRTFHPPRGPPSRVKTGAPTLTIHTPSAEPVTRTHLCTVMMIAPVSHLRARASRVHEGTRYARSVNAVHTGPNQCRMQRTSNTANGLWGMHRSPSSHMSGSGTQALSAQCPAEQNVMFAPPAPGALLCCGMWCDTPCCGCGGMACRALLWAVVYCGSWSAGVPCGAVRHRGARCKNWHVRVVLLSMRY